jgi:hypothetical protein
MSCNAWNHEWVASLYGEAEEAVHADIERHVAGCSECRERLERLAQVSRQLREAAPLVPAAPSVVLLRVPAPWRLTWAALAGATAAVVVMATGLAGMRMLQPGFVQPSSEARAVEASNTGSGTIEQALAEVVALRERLEALEREAGDRGAGDAAAVTRPELEQELRALFDHYEDQRAADMGYVLQTMAASEQRMDRNAQALTYLALRENPWVAEH